jgi:hypothetical protein
MRMGTEHHVIRVALAQPRERDRDAFKLVGHRSVSHLPLGVYLSASIAASSGSAALAGSAGVQSTSESK